MKRIIGFIILAVIIIVILSIALFALNFNYVALIAIVTVSCVITALLYVAMYLIHS